MLPPLLRVVTPTLCCHSTLCYQPTLCCHPTQCCYPHFALSPLPYVATLPYVITPTLSGHSYFVLSPYFVLPPLHCVVTPTLCCHPTLYCCKIQDDCSLYTPRVVRLPVPVIDSEQLQVARESWSKEVSLAACCCRCAATKADEPTYVHRKWSKTRQLSGTRH